jgi:hypothetical protein
MMLAESTGSRDMKRFEFTTEDDGQGRIKPLPSGTGHMFPGCASYGAFCANLDALIAELDDRIRTEARRYFEELDKKGGWSSLALPPSSR